MNPPEVDLVYTWVDGDCPDHLTLRRSHAHHEGDLNPERFRDSLQMLRYSLRSAEQYLPWIRRVYLLTQRPQIPTWLNTAHPKLHIVHHDEIWENRDQLPSFNSNAIESFMHRLPGLARFWLYFNDDYFFGAPVSPSDLFNDDGSPKLLGARCRPEHGWGPWLRDRLVHPGWLEHAPNLLEKESWNQMLREFHDLVTLTRGRRFRSPQDARLHILYRRSRIRSGVRPVPGYRQVRFVRLHRIDNRLAYQRRELAKVRALRPRFFCLNDDQGPRPCPSVEELILAFLLEYFPHPSSFEVGSDMS